MFRSDPIGAPGVYFSASKRNRALAPERMDSCGFVGIAPRGPSRVVALPEWWRREEGPYIRPWREAVFATRRTVPVAVDSFDEYVLQFGAFEGPGRLPYAVASFFEQGGQRAWIGRIVHAYGSGEDDAGIALGRVDGALPSNGAKFMFRARNEGKWGNRLRMAIGYAVRPLSFLQAGPAALVFAIDQGVTVGTLLRLRFPGNVFQLRFIDKVREDKTGGRREIHVVFDPPLLAVPEGVQIVEGDLLVDDGDGRRESFQGVGLSPRHPRWLATTVCYDSQLVYPEVDWIDTDLFPAEPDHLPYQPVLPSSSGRQAQFSGGLDRYADLAFDDFFDNSWTLEIPDPGDGVQAFARHPEIASLVVPDLYCPEPTELLPEPQERMSLAKDEFSECTDPPGVTEEPPQFPEPCPLALDPELAEDRNAIIALQLRLVEFAETERNFVVLLDVPPGLDEKQITEWRSRFRSSYAAAYLPWLRISRRGSTTDSLLLLNPSAAAAGIIAQTELRFGVPHGPANQRVANAVDHVSEITTGQHDRLHPLGLNVFVKERGGIRLSAARTLSEDYGVRQLSVRRLLILLRRILGKQMHWMVFETNNARLRREVKRQLHNYLLELYRAGAFTGSREEEAFFVRCDEHNNPPAVVGLGRLIAEIGVAPAEPLEFILLRITRDGDSTLVAE